jgi:transcriptional regulator with XRE-family HTH domain|tara:strand:+ start:310 stop:528 length:219 start_codon:yes stop_codon:yes gene_type:complete
LTDPRIDWCHLIRDLRRDSGISQKDIAARARMPQRTFAAYEDIGSGRQLSVQKIERILDALGYEIDVFLKVR